MTGVVFCVKKFRIYLTEFPVEIHTDHRSLATANKLPEPEGRLARWFEKMQSFKNTLHYKRGEENAVADCVSRLPQPNRLKIDSV